MQIFCFGNSGKTQIEVFYLNSCRLEVFLTPICFEEAVISSSR